MNDLSRGRNNDNSKLAFQKVKPTIPAMKITILGMVDGLRSTYDIASYLGVPIHKISGRFSELKASHKIIQTSLKKHGNSHFAVYTKTNI